MKRKGASTRSRPAGSEAYSRDCSEVTEARRETWLRKDRMPLRGCECSRFPRQGTGRPRCSVCCWLTRALLSRGSACTRITHPSRKQRPGRDAEARSRAGIDRNKHVLAPIATPADVVRLVACADVVILSYATELPADPVTIRTQHPSLLLVTMCRV